MSRLLLLSLALTLAACETDPETDAVSQPGAVAEAEPTEQVADPSAVATPTSTVRLDYEGRLDDGTVFDSGEDVLFPLPQLIPGFRDNVVGMKAGETKTFTVAPEDGYGDNPPPGIPAGADLTFEVTAHEIL